MWLSILPGFIGCSGKRGESSSVRLLYLTPLQHWAQGILWHSLGRQLSRGPSHRMHLWIKPERWEHTLSRFNVCFDLVCLKLLIYHAEIDCSDMKSALRPVLRSVLRSSLSAYAERPKHSCLQILHELSFNRLQQGPDKCQSHLQQFIVHTKNCKLKDVYTFAPYV